VSHQNQRKGSEIKFLHLITAATVLLSAPVAHAMTLHSDNGMVSFDAGTLSFTSDNRLTNPLDIIVSLSETGQLNNPTDIDFTYVSATLQRVNGRALSIFSVFDDVGEDSITMSFTPTTDETGTYTDPFWVVLTGQFGTGFAAFTPTNSGFATAQTVEPMSVVPLPASILLLAAALGVLGLRHPT
jgi:hypothetical protein